MKHEVLGIKAPQETCTDIKCPFHGEMNVKPELFRGTIIKKDTSRSATIEWSRSHYVPKYERYEVRRSRLRVHNPECVGAEIGHLVVVARTRPLSKTKNHVIIGLLDREKDQEDVFTADDNKTAKEATAKEADTV